MSGGCNGKPLIRGRRIVLSFDRLLGSEQTAKVEVRGRGGGMRLMGSDLKLFFCWLSPGNNWQRRLRLESDSRCSFKLTKLSITRVGRVSCLCLPLHLPEEQGSRIKVRSMHVCIYQISLESLLSSEQLYNTQGYIHGLMICNYGVQ